MTERKTAVVTGATKGIGKGLAREFLKRGLNVVICGRTRESVDAAITDLAQDAANGAKVTGYPCDVSQYDQVEALWTSAASDFGRIDIWINNAGMSNTRFPIGRLLDDEVLTVPATNLIGTMNGARVAVRGMTEQGAGALYNFEGFGSNGAKMMGLSLYGCTKFGITYFTKALVEETRSGPVTVGYLSPGIVLTDLSLRDRERMPPERWAYVKKIFNILADRVETVAPWLVDQVLANTKHGARFAWLTPRKSALRFLKARIMPPGERLPELG